MRITKEKIKKGLSIVVIVLISSAISVLVTDYFKKNILGSKEEKKNC